MNGMLTLVLTWPRTIPLREGDRGYADMQAIELCNMALNNGQLDRKDRAGTLGFRCAADAQ